MKILVVSDSHGRIENLRRAIQIEHPFDLLLHCGDIEGDEGKIHLIAETPCFMVSGNNDLFTDLPRELEFQITDRRAFLTHGHHYYVYMDTERLLREALSRKASFAFFGHTHKPLAKSQKGVWLVNPGSLSYPRQEGRRPSYITMEIDYAKEPIFQIKYL